MGGILLPVEVVTMAGKGDLLVTGQLGDVMRESVMAALSYIRTRANELHIDPNFQDGTDLHIHLPENAIPKEGPSAGITIAVAIVSALTRRPVRNDIAMTGEITLLGSVLGIGGLKEKVLAAQQANIRNLIIPTANQKDLAEIPAKIRQQLHFSLVENIDQVLEIALLKAPQTEEQYHTENEPLPIRREEHISKLPDQNLRRSGMPASEQQEPDKDTHKSSAFMVPPIDQSQQDSFQSAHAEKNEKKI
jgi:ATP-dependent Lon protease